MILVDVWWYCSCIVYYFSGYGWMIYKMHHHTRKIMTWNIQYITCAHLILITRDQQFPISSTIWRITACTYPDSKVHGIFVSQRQIIELNGLFKSWIVNQQTTKHVQFIDEWHQIWKLREIYFWKKNIHVCIGLSVCNTRTHTHTHVYIYIYIWSRYIWMTNL